MPPFNPTLVRLGLACYTPIQQTRSALSIPLWFDWGPLGVTQGRGAGVAFNPTLVRLGRAWRERLSREHPAFNPTLVRLGPDDELRPPGHVQLSIPLWFDWGRLRACIALTIRVLSIPLWFDWGWWTTAPTTSFPGLSIPLWFDWGICISPPAVVVARAFNPTLVRLGLIRAADQRGWPPAFNPTLVRLGHPPRPPGALHRAALSIPLWFDWGLADRGIGQRARGSFQSHFGSIGARLWPEALATLPPVFQSHFGSIGAASGALVHQSGATFQSHFGSIGAPGHLRARDGAAAFQSHFGSIGARCCCWCWLRRCCLSIPLWFDWGAAPRQRWRMTRELSIPLWFDWGR